MTGKIGVIIPAAGAGKRLGGVSKPLIEVGGKPIILRLIDLFAGLKNVSKICVAAPQDSMRDFRTILKPNIECGLTSLIEGGTERPLSVKNAFGVLIGSLSDDDLICVHDAARPLLSAEDLDRVIDAAWKHGAAFLASRVKDTLKIVDEDGFCTSTVDRSKVFAAQTPQVIRAGLLKEAYARVPDCSALTDEIMLMEKIDVKAFVVEPRHLNFKVTTSQDLELLRKVIS